MSQNKDNRVGFALYEVLLGVTIFAVGVLSLGWSVQNCLNASTLSAEDDRVRQILADRMAEIQASPGTPDKSKETKVATGYGDVLLRQKVVPAGLKGQNNLEVNGVNTITLSAEWKRNGIEQTRRIQFYLYRNG